MTSIFIRNSILGLISLYLLGCNNSVEYNENLWVGNQQHIGGGYAHYDYATPLPNFLEFKTDSIFFKNYKNEIRTKIKAPLNKILDGESFTLFETDFTFIQKKNKGILQSTQNSNNVLFEIHFNNPLKTLEWERQAILNTLTNRTFIASVIKNRTPNSNFDIKKTLQFSLDSLTTTFSYLYDNELLHQETRTKSYFLSEIEGAFFFTENDDNSRNSHKLYQIIDLKRNGFSIYYQDEQKEVFENYSMVDGISSDNIKSYISCSEMRPLEYYGIDFTYTKGNDYIIEKISEHAPETMGDGYITVHFNVNCKNQIGQFGLEMMDRKYQPARFDSSLVSHIVQEILKLEDWPTNDTKKNVHAFLMFKIENGKITDVCP